MKFRNPALTAICILLLQISSSTDAVAATPLEVFGHLPGIENVALSPDGLRLALTRTRGDKRFLVVISLTDSKVISSQEVAGVKLRDLQWADNNNLILTISKFTHTRGTYGSDLAEHYVLASLNVDKNKIVNPLENIPEAESRDHAIIASQEIISDPVIRTINNEVVVFVAGLSGGSESQNASGTMFLMPTLFKFKAGINITHPIVRATDSGTEWLVDEKGREFVNSSYSEDGGRWTLKTLIDGKWKEVLSERFSIESPNVVGVSPDGNSLWVGYTDEKTEESSWMGVSLRDGKITRALLELDKYSGFILSTNSPRVIGGRLGKTHSIEFFDTQLRESWAAITSHYRGEHVEFVTASDNFKKIIVQVEGVRDGYAYSLFDADTFDFTLLGAVYSGLNKVAEVTEIAYEAADKYPLSSFVTYPEGDRKNLPVIVLPHGGPEAHDDGYFDWWAQALAAQGYAVIQPNFRGSDVTIGLRDAGFKEWGRKMQTDLSDAVRKLVKDGIADAKRVCIVGGSYGGYAALAGATLDTDVYRCAVSVAGISDLAKYRQSLVAKYDRHDSTGTRYFDRYLGTSGSSDSTLNELSPIQHIDKVNIPILLIHGKDDSVVPYEQSEIMFNALKKANKPVELVTLTHEDHWLSNSDTRMQMLQATVDFLLKNNPPK
jgi:dipeptidyl aminopeptidase/acylaminoacyl peptidase